MVWKFDRKQFHLHLPPDGKKCFLISSMISLALVIPLATISFITFMTVSYLIFIAAATSLILAHHYRMKSELTTLDIDVRMVTLSI